MEFSSETRTFSSLDKNTNQIKEILRIVCAALEEKGYRPVDQIVGYLVSGDPSYITSHMDARSLMQKIERNDLLEEIIGSYLENLK